MLPSRRATRLVLLSSESRGAASARGGWLVGRGSVAAMKAPELLDLLGRIEQAAIDGDVVQALLLCQKLGGDADSAELRDWAKRELEGYPEGVPPPEYRRVAGHLFASGAAPGARVSAVPIPMEALPEPERSVYERGIPLLNSISEIEERATETRVVLRPSGTVRMLHAVNSSNQAPTMFDDIYLRVTGSGFGAVVTAVRSRIVGLVAQLRESLSADQQLDSAAVGAAVSKVITGSMVNVTGDNNLVTVGDGGHVSISAGSDDGSPAEPKRRIWRWLKRILEAVTAIGTVVSVSWGGAGSPL